MVIGLQKHIFQEKISGVWVCIYCYLSVRPHSNISKSLYVFLGVEYMYEQSEFVEKELEQMTEQIKSIIQTLNANQVNTLS